MAAPDSSLIDQQNDADIPTPATPSATRANAEKFRGVNRRITAWAIKSIIDAMPWRRLADAKGSVDETDIAYRTGRTIIGGNQDDGTNSALQVRGTASMDGLFANNGDGQTPKTTTLAGQSILRVFANLIPGLSEFSFVNTNLFGQATAFWYMANATTKVFQVIFRGPNVGVGVIDPQHRLEVAGRIKAAGLVAGGGVPVAIGLTGLGGGSVTLRTGSTDQCGQIILNTGANPTSNDPIVRLTYSTVQPAEPVCVLLTGRNQLAARDVAKVVLLTDSNSSLTLFGSNNGSALAANSTYIYNYFVVV